MATYATGLLTIAAALVYVASTTAVGLPAKVLAEHGENPIVRGLDGSLSVKWTLFAPVPPTRNLRVLAQVRCADHTAIEGGDYLDLTAALAARNSGGLGASSRLDSVLSYLVTDMSDHNQLSKAIKLARERGVNISKEQEERAQRKLKERELPSFHALAEHLVGAHCRDGGVSAYRMVAVSESLPVTAESEVLLVMKTDWLSPGRRDA